METDLGNVKWKITNKAKLFAIFFKVTCSQGLAEICVPKCKRKMSQCICICIFGAYRELILIQLYSVKVFFILARMGNAQGARRKVKNESVLNCKRRHCETVSVVVAPAIYNARTLA